MGMLLSTRRALLQRATGEIWTPALPTSSGGVSPEHWYRSNQGLWQDAGITPAAADGDVVGRWEDLTANADHVNQAVAGNKPTLQNGAADLLNGHPVVRFDGAGDFLRGAFTTGGALSQPFTVFVVTALDAAAVNSGWRFLLDGDDANSVILRQSGIAGNDAWGMDAGVQLNGASGTSDSNWNIWSALFNGASSQLWENGISIVSGDAGAENADGLTIAANTADAFTWDGDIVEILIYDAGLSDADKNQVGQYLGARYAISYTDI